jgi:SAM-dependent methyltransferase
MSAKRPAAQLDDPVRILAIRTTVKRKKSLFMFYAETYTRFQRCIARVAGGDGLILELGSGGGFAQEMIPGLISSDVISYPGVDQVVDASKLPFGDETLKAILLFNVFHHIPDVEAFLSEAKRCLKPGGRILIVDQYRGWISQLVLKYFHHEEYDTGTRSWKFKSRGPLSGANGALAWIVFFRDRKIFEQKFPELEIALIHPHSPLRYWLTGGLKSWSLLPPALYEFVGWVDRVLVRVAPSLASFVDVELVRKP